MPLKYARIDMMRIIDLGVELDWLHHADDSEWRDDYQCFFILIGSKTYTYLVMKYDNLFD